MSFREHNTSAEVRMEPLLNNPPSNTAQQNCATLLTLHLLDARPLSDTLSIFLAQRTKTLHTMLAWRLGRTDTLKSKQISSFPLRPNGHPPDASGEQRAIFGRATIRDVKKATLAALGVVFRTLSTTRDIFQHCPARPQAMMISALEYIHSDSPSPAPSRTIPPQILLDTEGLLATLPSSTHFSLLPPSLRSYRPYVDPSSSASSVPQSLLNQKLDEWFRKSAERLQHSVKTWFSDLQCAREVWSIRSSILTCIDAASGIDQDETLSLKSSFDNACLERLLDIWKERLQEAGQTFRDRLVSVVMSIAKDDDIRPAGLLTILHGFG